MKVIKENIKTHKIVNYKLPVMTSINTPVGLVEYDVSITGNSATEIYPMFFSGTDVVINCYAGNTKDGRYIRYTFPYLLATGQYTLECSGARQSNVTITQNEWVAIYEDDTTESIMSNFLTATETTHTATFTATKPIKAIQFNITATASSTSYCYIYLTGLALDSVGYDGNVVTIMKPVDCLYKVVVDNDKYYAFS